MRRFLKGVVSKGRSQQRSGNDSNEEDDDLIEIKHKEEGGILKGLKELGT